MDRRSLGIGIVIGLGAGAACFGLGLAAARMGATPAGEAKEPRIVIPEGAVQLLPDASLRLDLPWDAGPIVTPGIDPGR